MRGIVRVSTVMAALLGGMLWSSVASADRFTSTNYTIDASSVGSSISGPQSSTNYQLKSVGGDSAVGGASGGSYILGQGAEAQQAPSIELTAQNATTVLYYPFNENSGVRVSDYSDTDKYLDFVGTPTWGTGKIGTGITTSTNNALQTASAPTFTSGNLTACAWFNPSATGTNLTLIGQGNSTLSTTGMWSLNLLSASTRPQASINIGGTVYQATYASNVGTGTWSYACMTYKASTNSLSVYVNNSAVVSTTTSGTWTAPATALTVGSRTTSTYFVGSIDEVKVYDAALSAADISTEYSAQTSGILAGLNIGTVAAGTPLTGDITVMVQTDAPGYSLAVSQDHNLQNGAITIPAITSGTIASPVAWSNGTTKGLGFTNYQLTSAGTIDPKWGAGANYAAIPGSATTFFTRQANDNDRDMILLRMKLDVANTQTSGTYQNTLTWTGTMLP